jgi:hypothetical protein
VIRAVTSSPGAVKGTKTFFPIKEADSKSSSTADAEVIVPTQAPPDARGPISAVTVRVDSVSLRLLFLLRRPMVWVSIINNTIFKD